MILYEYTLDFDPNSLNKDKYFNIYFENNKIAEKIQFPHKISFNKWQSSYDIIVENDNCGSKKTYQLFGQSTTTYTTQVFPTTNPIWIRPTTTQRPTSTTLTTSTTTLPPKFVQINSISVTNCSTLDNKVLVNTLIKFNGNYSNKLLIQITNIDTNVVVRRFDGGIISTNALSYNLPIGKYKFEIKDAENELLTDSKTNVIINCPAPTFDIQYIANSCGQNDAKLRIYNIKNANKFRYCFGQTFFCDINFDNPDAILEEPMTEITINLNSGQSVDYTHGDFITVRGFNLVAEDFTDITVELTPCIKSGTNEVIYFTSAYKNLKLDENGNNVRITISLVQNGKKVNAPIDISISGFYTISQNGTYVQQKFDTIVPQGKNTIIINKVLDINSEIFDSCISNLEPSYYFGTYFQNNSPCS